MRTWWTLCMYYIPLRYMTLWYGTTVRVMQKIINICFILNVLSSTWISVHYHLHTCWIYLLNLFGLFQTLSINAPVAITFYCYRIFRILKRKISTWLSSMEIKIYRYMKFSLINVSFDLEAINHVLYLITYHPSRSLNQWIYQYQ